MKKKVILYREIPDNFIDELAGQYDLIYFKDLNENNLDDFKKELQNTDGIIGSSTTITSDILKNAQKLKVISTISVGVDQFDIDFITQQKIKLMHTPNVLTDTTADLIFALMLTSARRIVEMHNKIKKKEWHHSIQVEDYGVNVHHKTVGIIGMGRIGEAVAKRANLGFDMNVLYYNRHKNIHVETYYHAVHCELEELLEQSDFVVITVPLTTKTEKLIDKEQIQLMKYSAILINASRGKVINQEALIEALISKRIFSAGLDVFTKEPLELDSSLMNLDNIVMTPHIGSATLETRNLMTSTAIKNLNDVLHENTVSDNWFNKF